jgi:hypothetical protein
MRRCSNHRSSTRRARRPRVSAAVAPSRRLLDQIPWPLRSAAAGTSGTAALGLAYALERRVRRSPHGEPLDYDDSDAPGKIVVSILHLGHVSQRGDMKLGATLRWSYGSAFGLWQGVLRRHIREPWASLGFGMTLMIATFTLFPLLGRTPPPWRWPKGYIATCVFTHAAYVITVGVVDHSLRDGHRSSPAVVRLRSSLSTRSLGLISS